MHTHPRMLVVNALKSCICILVFSVSLPAKAQLNISEWKNYGQLAEQGAVCAGFAAIMETQDVISQDIGQLWSERRKYSGALIRNAGRLETGNPPTASEIDQTISLYREWIFANLVQTEEEVALNPENDTFSTGQGQIRRLLKTNCEAVYQKADDAIFQRFPELSYLSDPNSLASSIPPAHSEPAPSPRALQSRDTETTKKLETLLATNLELNRKLQDAQNTIESFRQRLGIPADIEIPTSRIEAAGALAAQNAATNASSDKPQPIKAETTTQISSVESQNQKDKIVKVPVPSVSKPVENTPIAPSKTTKPDDTDNQDSNLVKTAETQTAQKLAAPSIVSSKNAKPILKNNSADNRHFLIQLASFRTRKRAESVISELYEKRPNLFSSTTLRIQSHTLPSGNILFRVISTPTSRDEATSLCEMLWTERIGCLIKSAG